MKSRQTVIFSPAPANAERPASNDQGAAVRKVVSIRTQNAQNAFNLALMFDIAIHAKLE